MIVTEKVIIGDKEFIRTYSDAGKMIQQVETGDLYSDAIDNIPHEYEETEEDIETPQEKE